MKKILVIYASAGDGHKKAAEAVYTALQNLSRDDIDPVLIDSLNYTSRFFKYSYKVGYMFLIKYLPLVWGFVYYILDNRFVYAVCRPFRRLNNALSTKRLVEFLHKEDFDLVISTHFLAEEVICRMKQKGLLSVPIINIITDFKSHRFWEFKNVDYYTVGAEATKEMLIARGIPQEKIKVLGMPVRSRFNKPISKEQARLKLKLEEDRFTILVMGGGFGVGPIENIVSMLQGLDFDCQMIVVCGHNVALVKKMRQMRKDFTKTVHILGFCVNVDEIMAASDLMVSKSGGITVTEAMIKELPVLTLKPMPGQEMRNADFLGEKGIGFKVKDVDELISQISRFHNSPEELKRVKERMRSVARPSAADDIARLALRLLTQEDTE